MTETNKQTLLYRFLVEPKFRIWRHILLIFSLATIAFNQAFLSFHSRMDIVGNNIYWLCFAYLFAYVVVAYFNYYYLAPRFLINKKYIMYAVILFLSVVALYITLYILEHFMCEIFGLPFRANPFTSPIIMISALAYCIITYICFLGTSMGKLLNHFMTESQHVSQLEKEYVQSEVDNLKEQIAPDFLFKILKYTSILVKTEPSKASEMLMRLSQLLRYQLYDCSRDKVLLNSAIRFISNYLYLEQLYSSKINYQISTSGKTERVFIPPLLLVTFVRHAVSEVSRQSKDIIIYLHFEVEEENNETVFFTCAVNDGEIALDGEIFSSIRQRLNLLYGKDYNLVVNRDIIKLQFNSL